MEKIRKIATEIMMALSGRRGIDLYQYDDDIIKEIEDEIVEIIEKGVNDEQ